MSFNDGFYVPDNNLWADNEKGNACVGCPYEEHRDDCMVSGYAQMAATITVIMPMPTAEEFDSKRQGDGRGGGALRQEMRAAAELAQQELQLEDGMPAHYNVGFLSGRFDPSVRKTALNHCQGYLRQRMLRHREQFELRYPDSRQKHVIMACGRDVFQALTGERGKYKNYHGLARTIELDGHEYVVVPTLRVSHMLKTPGTSRIFREHARSAFKIAYGGTATKMYDLETLSRDYVLPENEEELEALVEEILAYSRNGVDPDNWPISVDTETTGLDTHDSRVNILMVSFSWDDGKATTIVLDHEERPYSRSAAKRAIQRLLQSPKPKVLHNLKYDYKMMDLNYSFGTRNYWFDTMLGAYFLDEELKGFFGLDALTKLYTAQFSGYKAMIKEGLKQKVRDRLTAGLEHDYPDADVSWHIMPFWPDLVYEPVSGTQEFLENVPENKQRELFDLEVAYVRAVAEKTGDHGKYRTRITYRCKKYGLRSPDTASLRDYDKEMEDDGFAAIPYDVLLVYAAADADATRQICKKIRSRARRDGVYDDMSRLMAELLLPSTSTLARMEFRGMRVDRDLLFQYQEELHEKKAAARQAMQDLVGDSLFDPGAEKDLQKLITRILPIDPDTLQLTDAGGLSVQAAWLKSTESAHRDAGDAYTADMLYNLLKYRGYEKALSSFVNKMLALSELDGRLHTSFSVNGTVTGRLSSSRMNLQNIPKYVGVFRDDKGYNLKKVFLPNPGQLVWGLDISAAEIRVLAAYAKDPELTYALNAGLNVHSYVTCQIFEYDYYEFEEARGNGNAEYDLQRTGVKRVVFGTIYGAGPRKIAEQIFGTLSLNPEEERTQVQFAVDIMNALFQRFPGINAYIQETQAFMAKHHYAVSMFGRRRRFPLAGAHRRFFGNAKREAVNFKIQSTASDLVLSQLVAVDQNIHKLRACLQLTVHDSMVGSIPARSVPHMRAFFDEHILQSVRERYPWLPVPFKYDLEIGPTYGEQIDFKYIDDPENIDKAHNPEEIRAQLTQMGL